MADVKLEAVDVTIENLSLAYDASNVLNDVNLTIKAGELFTFLGPSGSGKSTLLRAIAGFGPQPRGKIVIGVSTLVRWRHGHGMLEWCFKATLYGRICQYERISHLASKNVKFR